jgi:hypothetical protein
MFLQADYNIDCSSSRYQSSRSFATVMVLVYPAGVPMAYFALVYYGRKPGSRVAEEATAVSQLACPPPTACVVTDPHLSTPQQLLASYKPEFWYWEVVECARKLTLTGVFVVVLRGSLLQATLAVLLMVAFTLTLCHLSPYTEEHGDSRTNALAVVTNAQLVIVLQASLVLQAASITPAAGSSNDPLVGLNDGALSAVLILASASSVVVLAYLVYADGRRYLRDGEEREGAGAENTRGAENDVQSTSMKTAEVQQPRPAPTQGDDSNRGFTFQRQNTETIQDNQMKLTSPAGGRVVV